MPNRVTETTKWVFRGEQQTGYPWLDVGRVVLAEYLGTRPVTRSEIQQTLDSLLIARTGNKGYYYNQQTNRLEPYDKVNWVPPADIFIRIPGRSTGKRVIVHGRDYRTAPPALTVSLGAGRNGTCDACGTKARVRDAGAAMMPLLVNPSKFANFYPSLRRGFQLCLPCTAAGYAAFAGCLHVARGSTSHLVLFHGNPSQMAMVYRLVVQPYRHMPERLVAFRGAHTEETVLALLLRVFAHQELTTDAPEPALQTLGALLGLVPAEPALVQPLRLIVLTAERRTRGFDVHRVYEYESPAGLYAIYRRWLEALHRIRDDPRSRIERAFAQFVDRAANDTRYRNEIARAVLEARDPLPWIESFLFDVALRANRPLETGTEEIFAIYANEVLEMSEALQRTIGSFGWRLGRAAHAQREFGVLYSLRNARTPEQYLRVLNDAQFRLSLTIPSLLISLHEGERIEGTPWLRVKTLLCISAMNAYLRAKDNSVQQHTEGEGTDE